MSEAVVETTGSSSLADAAYAQSMSGTGDSAPPPRAPHGLYADFAILAALGNALQNLQGAVASIATSNAEFQMELSNQATEVQTQDVQDLQDIEPPDSDDTQENNEYNDAVTDKNAEMQSHQTMFQNAIAVPQALGSLYQNQAAAIAQGIEQLFNYLSSFNRVWANLASITG